MDYNNSLLEQVSLTKSIHRMKNFNPLNLTCNGFKPEGSKFLESEINCQKYEIECRHHRIHYFKN